MDRYHRNEVFWREAVNACYDNGNVVSEITGHNEMGKNH